MKNGILIGSVLLSALASCDKDDKDENTGLNATDQMFVPQVAIGNTAEINGVAIRGVQRSSRRRPGFWTDHGY